MTDEEKADKHTIGHWLQFIKENNDDAADFNFGFSKIIEIAKQLEKENSELKITCQKLNEIKNYLAYDIPHELTNEATNKIWRMI